MARRRPTHVDGRAEAAGGRLHLHGNPDLVCLMDYGVSCVGDPDTVFLDVRSDDEWSGAGARGNKRAGHVPGAVHLEWLNLSPATSTRPSSPPQSCGRCWRSAA